MRAVQYLQAGELATVDHRRPDWRPVNGSLQGRDWPSPNDEPSPNDAGVQGHRRRSHRCRMTNHPVLCQRATESPGSDGRKQ